MDPHCTRVGLPVILVVMSMVFSCPCSAIAKDIDMCTNQLVGLATCLPYVGGNAKAPTPDCCSGLKQVLKTNKTCLCVIIKDRNDPELGLSINVTLALGLPSVCNAPANVSQCPTLLHLAPNSPDAQVFYQFGHGSNTSASSPVASVKPNATSANGTTGATGQALNDGHCSRKRWLGLEVIIGGVLLCFFTSHLFI